MVSLTNENIIPTSKPLLPRPHEDPGALVERRAQPTLDELRLSRPEQKSKRYFPIAIAGILAVAGAFKTADLLTAPAGKTVPEIVQPRDSENPSLVAERAEAQYGSDPTRFNIQEEALRIAQQYGRLHTGEQVEVHVK